ncbi:Protein of unknown function DUF3712 [Ceraceosorus bombacis]|uniref:Uncharacterized protein n=1 Tax=Ceraceosorus bombacis TaxID=401625 RepID=A0A0P1BLG6_9BASI|nr:Protein of unknown function DUF3712 [Ceraceosorus bombacis]
MADDAASYGSRGGLVNRRGGRASGDTSRSNQQMYQPGQPIGYLAARGTPYEKKYFTKKLGFCCLFLAPPIIIVSLVIALVPVIWAVAVHALKTAQLHVYAANITDISNTSFPITIEGQVKKAGIFPAHLFFREPVDIYWMTPPEDEGGMRELHLGSMELARIGAAAGHARVKQATTFNIADEAGFGRFSEYLVTQEEFTWQLRCLNVHAEAFSFFPTFKNLQFIKNVVFKGINNFGDIKILNLQLPGDDPEGGIITQATTRLVNPSPFGVQVGTLNLALYYKGMYLGPVAAQGLNLTAGENIVTISGRLVPHADNSTELDLLGELFTNYINGDVSPVTAVGVSTQQADGREISWLSQGLKALRANIPFQSPEPIDPIKGIQIDYLSLVYNQERPFNPDIFSNDLTGTFALPFGFSLNILSLAAELNILYRGAPVGTVYGPYSNSSTNINVLNAGQTAGTIDITLPPSQLFLPNNTQAAQQQLIEFQNEFTYSDEASFTTRGSAKTITDTPLGRVLLNGIKFNVTTGLRGLSGLLKYPTIINSVDVMGGAPDAVSLAVALTTVNPSNLNLTVGDATFQLINGVALGNATLPNLNLKIGRNDINSTSFFDPNRDPKGLETLNRFISGLDTNLNITGFDRSSNIASLNPTFGAIHLNATLPGLKRTLVQSANLTVLDSTGTVDDIANSNVALANPFTSPLTISRIAANASAHGVYLANIDTPLQFPAAGKATTMSPNIPLAVNLYPPDLFAILRAFAIDGNLNPAYIDGIVQLGGFTLTPTTAPRQIKRDLVEDAAPQESFVLEDDDEMAQLFMGTSANPGPALSELNEDEGYAEEFNGEETGSVAKRALPLPQAGMAKRDNLYTGFNLANYVLDAFRTATADLTIVSDATIGDYGTTLTFSQNNVPLGVDDTLLKLLPVLAGPIVQKIVDGSILNIDRVTITEAAPTSFRAALQGALTNAGPFDGTVSFPEGLTIYWEGRPLTSTAFPNITLTGDLGASLNIELEGQIPDVGYFTDFLKMAITSPSFVWNIRGSGISVAALGIVTGGITINKDVQLRGLEGLRNQVIINSFDVPYNEPGGGIHLTAVSTINNPAQVGVALSQFGVNIFRNGSLVGPSRAESAFTLQALAVTTVPLVGSIVPQEGFGLEVLGEILTNFVHDRNTGLNVRGEFAGPSDVVWLNEGIKVLDVEVALPSQKFDVIRQISINQLSLFFTVATAWNPQSDTSNTTANFFLPFSLPIDIKTVEGPFIANYQGRDFAVLNIPRSDSLTDVEARILTLMFNNVPFAVYDNAHSLFSQFVADVTARDLVTFNLHGQATSDTLTGAGLVTIRDIPFNLDTNILGLQNLNARPAIVSDLDVQQNVRAGQTLLENYVQNITSDAVVQGTSQTTPIPSLIQALSGIRLTAAIPPLMKLIVVQARLTVPRGIAQGELAQTSVMIANPFTASISIIQLYAQAVFQDIVLGYIDENLRGNPIFAPGKATTQSQEIPIHLDLDPKNLIRFILAAAASAGVSLGPLPPYLDRVLALDDTRTSIVPVPDTSNPPCVSGRAFDTLGAVLAALRGLATTIRIRSTVRIDEYQTDLNFVQSPVPTITDETALYLLGPAGAPLIQLIVDESVLTVNIANATRITNDGFFTSLQGRLQADTPADAYIEFPDPIAIEWEGTDIATISLPPICASPPDGVPNLVSAGQLTITNYGRFTAFASFILNNPSFQWRLHSDTVTVRALQIRYQNVKLSKTITLDAFNGLPGIRITDFQAPSDEGGANPHINIEATTPIPSPASLGVELGNANFNAFFQGTLVGPISSQDLFLAAKATTTTTLRGEIVRQEGQGLVNIGILFSQFLAGQDSILNVRGVSVITPYSGGQPVKWLSDAFKTFATDVVLPGKIYQIIYSITLSDLTAQFTNPPSADGYTALASNNRTVAIFANPFGFGLGVAEAGPQITITYEGSNAANLNLPLRPVVTSGTSRGPNDRQQLVLNFRDEPLVSPGPDHGTFSRFLDTTTNAATVNFGLDGSTDVIATTVIGNPKITGIPFNVSTSLDGIDSFGRKLEVSDVVVKDATSQYISIPLTATLNNPSDITLSSNMFRLPVLYKGANTGRAVIDPILLIPGTNRLATEFRYGPDNAADPVAQSLLQAYLQPVDGRTEVQVVPLLISGIPNANPSLSPYDSLELALSNVRADTTLTGIASRIVTLIEVYIPIEALIQGLTFQDVTVDSVLTSINDLPVILDIERVQGKIYNTNDPPGAQQYADLDHTFNAVYSLPAATATKQPSSPGTKSERISGIVLTRGLLASLPLIGKNVDVVTTIRAGVRGDSGEYTVPSLEYTLRNIETNYFIDLLGVPIPINALGDILDVLNGLTGGLLNQFLDAIGRLTTPQQNDLKAITGLSNVVCESQRKALQLVDPFRLLNPVLNAFGCTDLMTTTTSATSSTPNPVAAATSALGGVTSGIGAGASAVQSVASQGAAAATSVVGDVQSGIQAGINGAQSVIGGALGLNSRAAPADAPVAPQPTA